MKIKNRIYKNDFDILERSKIKKELVIIEAIKI